MNKKEEHNTWGGKREGAGRKTLYSDKKPVKVYLTDEALKKLDKFQKNTGLSRSDLVNEVIMKL